MVEEPSVAVVRRFYQAVAEGDFQTIRECFTEDAVWHLPGRSLIAGDHRGVDAILGNFLSKLRPLSGGTFRAGLLDVAVGDRHVVAIQRATANHNGKTLDVSACQLMTIRGGKIAEVQGHYSDLHAMDNFWSQ